MHDGKPRCGRSPHCSALVTQLKYPIVSDGPRSGGLENCMLVVEGLTCRFGTKAAVDKASFSIPPGSFVGVIGRSGAGKSTLLRMINRLAEPSEGRILFEGVDVTALRGRDLRQWRTRSAMIFQQFNLVGRLDVLTNVLMGRLAGIPSWRSLTQAWPA